MSQKELTTSALLRSLKLGGLVGRVGASMVGNRLAEIGRSDDAQAKRRAEAMVRNANRVVKTLGELKGAAMKVGQMLSLHEGLMPTEVSAVLRSLQKEAPRVPPEVMRFEVEGALDNFHELFESLEEEGFAAASIGQVHRGVLRDGRRVAVKVQYPLIDEIVKADLGNLRLLFKSLVALISDIEIEEMWEEVRDRLLEELDYTIEAEHMRRMAELHAGLPEIIIPRVVEEASTSNVLTMEFVEGIPPDEACSDGTDQELKNEWGRVLLEFQFRGLLEHRVLHADPNLANFAFREDGKVVVYDFGCVKTIGEDLARGYAELFLAVLEDRKSDVPLALRAMGVYRGESTPLENEFTDPYADVFGRIVRAEPPYVFGEDDLYDRLFEIGFANWSKAVDIKFPRDIVFVDRSFGGHMGNLSRFRASGPWREMVQTYSRARLEIASNNYR